MNSTGQIFRITLFGESHGYGVGITVDGCPAGLPLSETDFEEDLERRRGGAEGGTPRREPDSPEIISGIYRGRTTGAPITILFRNRDTRPEDYENAIPRPSHADFTANRKWNGLNDPRGGGRFSGRMTVGLVAAGAIAKKLLPEATFDTRIVEIGGTTDPEKFAATIRKATESGDSVGGIIRIGVSGLAVGWGEPFFDSAESVIAHLLFSIPAVKGVEFGVGFGAGRLPGSAYNDPLTDACGHTATNHDGGINGGITNGNELVVRAAIKPAPSISIEQTTFDPTAGRSTSLTIGGRHDTCIPLRAAVAIEAAVAVALADLKLLYRAASTEPVSGR